MSQQVQQRYQIVERLDAGGMAEVFKGKVTSLQGFEKLVAIKRILPDLTKDKRFVRMFLDEAKLSLYLNHTNIVQVFDIGHADNTYFIVMEFVNGVNLKHMLNALLQRGEQMPMEQAVFIAAELCKALSYAHERKNPEGLPLHIVHRDISPPNILISRNGEVKLTDFGLAKAVIQLEKTDPGIVKGKFGYLSPEAASGEEVDHLTDLFAVGICLWEMLASRRLFLGNTDIETLKQVRRCKIPSISTINPNVTPALEQLLQRALHPDKRHRFPTAQALGQALTQFLFSYGKAVTNYDVSTQIERLFGAEKINTPPPLARPLPIDRTSQVSAPSNHGVIDLLIQTEIDKFISIEELENLTDIGVVGAKPLQAEEISDTPNTINSLTDIGFEDPRTWSDVMGDNEGSIELDPSSGQPTARRPPLAPAPALRPNTQPNPPVRRPPVTRPPANAAQATRPPQDSDEPVETPSRVAWVIFAVLLLLLLAALGFLIFTLAFQKA